jgi:hypothetical protein
MEIQVNQQLLQLGRVDVCAVVLIGTASFGRDSGYSFISAELAKTRKAHGFNVSCTSPGDSMTASVSDSESPHRCWAESSAMCQRPGGIGNRSLVGA